MPPRKRISDPVGRVYKRVIPLKQATLPGAKKRIKTTYGKKASNRLSKQETLTQMDFVKLQQMQDQDQDDEEDHDDIEDMDVEVKKPKKKRRKTEGDEPDRTLHFHTQTITQLDWSFSEVPENDEEQEPEKSIFDVPSSSQSAKPPKSVKKRRGRANAAVSPPRKHASNSAPDEENESPPAVSHLPKAIELPKAAGKRKAVVEVVVSPPQKSPVRNMPPPQTPRRYEIPSSQSPATPLSSCSQGPARRSPLKAISMNTPIPFDSNPKAQESPTKLPVLRIEDSVESGTYESQASRVPSTPSKRPSPAKSVRFALPDVEEEEEEVVSPTKKLQSTPYPNSQTSLRASQRNEISDSEAESDDEELPELPVSTELGEEEDETGQEREGAGVSKAPVQDDDDVELEEETESCYGDIGLDTQMEAERILDSPRLSGIARTTQTEESPEPETFKERTQIMESQRLATQYMDMMAPRTTNSDIFISVSPQDVTKILSRVKDHFMKPFLAFPPSVTRVWIYETAPVSTLKYMAEISPAKCPGEIEDERGQGNADFNAKTNSTWIAYEFLQLYELADPLPLAKLTANEWLKNPPKRFEWVRPAVLDQLMANLKPPVFDDSELDDPTSSSTDTQEAEAQLLSTMKQFTQPAQSSQPQSSQFIKPEIEDDKPASSTYAIPFAYARRKAPPASQATTVDLSQTQTPRRQRYESVEEIIWESPTRPVPSSTPLKLPTPLSSGAHLGPDSLVPYSMASSQLLTKSQLLTDSLLNDIVPGPPPFIQDSDDEEELDQRQEHLDLL